MLQLLQVRAFGLQRFELFLGYRSAFLQSRELLPELFEDGKPLGSYVLIPAPLAICLGQLIEPHFCFSLGIAAHVLPLEFDHPLHVLSQLFGVCEQTEDGLPYSALASAHGS